MHAGKAGTYLFSPADAIHIFLLCAVHQVDEYPDQTWNGGCVVLVWDSDSANTWIDECYDHALLVGIRQKKIGGPIPSMLSADSAALVIFGIMSVSLVRLAEELANFSGFPVIVRPLEEDPSYHVGILSLCGIWR